MLWDSKHYDPAGHLVQQTVTNDDGTHTLTLYDVDNIYGWANATISFDATWNQTGLTGTRDNGSHTITPGEVAGALDTLLWFTNPYDANFGSAPVDTGLSGGAGNDILYGFAGNDTLDGKGGNDWLFGGRGNDLLMGGGGSDRFYFNAGDGIDTIADFVAGDASGDLIDLHGYGIGTFESLVSHMAQVGTDTVITLDPENQIILTNVMLAHLNAGDFHFS
jgi:Ca2+-binding RTX toxin-like protein